MEQYVGINALVDARLKLQVLIYSLGMIGSREEACSLPV
jgi:hypothetical protein